MKRQNKTTISKTVKPAWHTVDVSGKTLGRIATEISKLLIGKHKVDYSPNVNFGDKVVVTNSDKITVTGKKMKDKIYYRYTGYPGGIKSRTLEQAMKKDSTMVIRNAVKGMLPKNKLQKQRLKNLYIYKTSEHPHKGQLEKK